MKWYQDKIYLLPSDVSDIYKIDFANNMDIEILNPFYSKVSHLFNEFKTTRYKFIEDSFSNWDLPIKRNYAINYSMLNNFQKIVLIDDDIRGISPEVLEKGCRCLDYYSVAGCFVEDYPDTSIFGHLERASNIPVQTFISGSFLFLTTKNICSFFPQIYNEDWLFMLPFILKKDICSFGNIQQLEYDPFSNPHRAAFQEFGEIIADCLYALIWNKLYHLRNSLAVWDNFIRSRRQKLFEFLDLFSDYKIKKILIWL